MKEDFYRKIVDYIIENQNKFYRLAYSYVRNQEDALDVVQSSVCKALEHYGDLRREEAMKTWLYKIIVNESLKMLRENKRYGSLEGCEEKEGYYEEKGFDTQDTLYEQIGKLDLESQTVIKLRFYEDLTLTEIAEVTNLNLNTAKARLYRGLRSLKLILKEENL